jgi:hypothetical protein
MRKLRISSCLLIFVMVMVSLFTGCDKRDASDLNYVIEKISAEPDTIYSDNNVTFSKIRVVVKDEADFPVPSIPVKFSTDLGNMQLNATTDSSGVAETSFWDNKDIGVANIKAYVGSQQASTLVTIKDAPELDSIQIIAGTGSVKVNEKVLIKAKALTELGTPVVDGSILSFETSTGIFENDEGLNLGTYHEVKTTNGSAQLRFKAGTTIGDAIITVTYGDHVFTENLTITSGESAMMELETSVPEIDSNSGETVEVRAIVKDEYSNPVQDGVRVNFETDLGAIDGFALTDENGIARAFFSPGVSSGEATIKATLDNMEETTVISVLADNARYLRFAFDGQVDINVQGTGGNESHELQVGVYDMSGNLIDHPDTVYFEMITAPDGTNINYEVFHTNEPVAVVTTDGKAFASVNSGTQSGTVKIKAYLDDSISATKSNIVVHAGAPHTIDIGIGEYNTGENLGSGLWKIGVTALVSDSLGNPVDNGTAVWFSIIDTLDQVDWANVEGDAFVGNSTADVDSVPGVAFSSLIYDGSHTNDTIWIEVESGGLRSRDYFVLPMNNPIIDLIPDPGHVDFGGDNPTNPAIALINVFVSDEQGNPIKNALIQLVSNRGEFQLYEDYNVNAQANLVKTKDDGKAVARIKFYRSEVPEPQGGAPGEFSVEITGTLVGTDVLDQTSVTLLRYN